MAVTAENGSGGAPKRRPKGRKKAKMADLPGLKDIYEKGPYLLTRPGVLGLALDPRVLAALAVYHTMEYTQPYWGPRVAEHGRQTRRGLEELFTGDWESIPMDAPWSIPEGARPRQRPRRSKGRRKPEKEVKRKVTKANKAFKKAYQFVTKGFKGKMTQKKCRYFMRKASKMAGKANPHTKSRIGKSKNAITRHCRKIRKGVWGVTKRA